MRRLPLRSPPRVRGKAKNRCRSCPLTRITPAYAGKSSELMQKSGTSGDHPRVCGEKKRLQPTITAQPGSPPRMRGKAASGCLSALVCRITPAYAGKSPAKSGSGSVQRDHPRVCGEKIHQLLPCRGARGSPPRMRGKVHVRPTRSLQRGITPAYAGKRESLPA